MAALWRCLHCVWLAGVCGPGVRRCPGTGGSGAPGGEAGYDDDGHGDGGGARAVYTVLVQTRPDAVVSATWRLSDSASGTHVSADPALRTVRTFKSLPPARAKEALWGPVSYTHSDLNHFPSIQLHHPPPPPIPGLCSYSIRCASDSEAPCLGVLAATRSWRRRVRDGCPVWNPGTATELDEDGWVPHYCLGYDIRLLTLLDNEAMSKVVNV